VEKEMAMTSITRRSFLKRGSLAAGAAIAIAPHARVLGANDDIRMGVIGFHSQGRSHIQWLRGLPGVRVVALCDVDQNVLSRELKALRDKNEQVEGYKDVRALLDNKNIDAVSTATPDHWHALVTVWACQAGKDVYVEKPLCHNLREGRQMVEAARKHNRIVQFGLQDHGHATGETVITKEGLGKILVAHTALFRQRESIGKVEGPQPIPASIDYDLWTGPAPLEPLRRKSLHYDWHWVWPTGTGEIGNNGIYQLDAVRLALGIKTLPKRAMSIGGRFLFNDDGETPNTQIALFDYSPGPLVIFELRNLPDKEGPKMPRPGVRCEQGESDLPKWSGQTGDMGGFSAHQGHQFNFIKAVRSRNRSDQRAEVLEGYLSTALVHLANISYRLGATAKSAEIRERVKDSGPDAVDAFERFLGHLAEHGVDWSKTEAVLGPWLELDPEREEFVGASPLAARANALRKGRYREPFVIRDNV
jgi:predicted dehydrogenase